VPGNQQQVIDVLQIRGEQALYALSPVTGKSTSCGLLLNTC
jgi:hypothetical protein